MAKKKKTAKSKSPAPWWRARAGKRALIGVGVAVAVVAAYAGYWNFIAGQLRAGIGQWAEDRRADGFEVSYQGLTIGGFPFRLEAAVASPKIASPKGRHPWAWQGPDMVFWVRPWRISRIKVEAPGLHQVSIMAAGGGNQPEDYFIDAATLRGKVRYRRGGPDKIRLAITDLVVRNAADEDVAGARAFDLAMDIAGGNAAAIEIAVEAEGLHLPLEPIPGLGRDTRHLGFKVQATGDFPDIARRIPVNGETMARWRDSGGTLEIRRLDLSQGPLTVSGDGTLALDQAMQPIGSFTFLVGGYLEALDRFRDAGLIKPQPHALAKVVLGTLAGKQGGEGATGLKVPLTVQDRRLYIGPVAVAVVPLLRWP